MNNLIQRRKQEISAMSRKELNAHAFLLEQEQEEYEREKRSLCDHAEAQAKEIEQDVKTIREWQTAFHSLAKKKDQENAKLRAEIERLRWIHEDYQLTSQGRYETLYDEKERLENIVIQFREQRDAAVKALEWYAEKERYKLTIPVKNYRQYESAVQVDDGERARVNLSHIKGGK